MGVGSLTPEALNTAIIGFSILGGLWVLAGLGMFVKWLRDRL